MPLLAFYLSIHSCLNINATEEKQHLKINCSINNNHRVVKEEMKEYWYDGKAEISSYNLKQIRYGEIHEGTVVLIYVTEPFSKKHNTKADYANTDNIPILKLNTSKKLNTGIYPYSMMNSTFFPFNTGNTSLKISASIQEWCGMTYTEISNNGKNLCFNLDSYFENASFKNKTNKIELSEDDI